MSTRTTATAAGARPLDDAPAAVPASALTGVGRARPAVFAGIWLVYLVQPVLDAVRRGTAWSLVAVVALLAFAGLFVLGSLMVRSARREQGVAVVRVAVLLVVMLGLLVLAAPGAGASVTGGTIYIGVLSVMALPGRVALPVVVALAVASEVVPRVVPGWDTDSFFAFQILIACFAAWGVTQIIARNAELLKAREEIGRLAVADERARLSRDLHDILGHSLTVITVKAELAGRLAEAEGAPGAQAEIGDVERLAREALADVRATVGGMRGVTLAGELAGARTALEAAGIAAHLPSSVDDVPAERRELFAWAVREGVTNVVRHSRAGACVVRLTASSVEVQDDGCGPSSGGGGQGLAGLRDRASAADAAMTVGSAPGGGFVLRVAVA
ncbi:hypothetical protein GCM10027446_17210 [Angustibacter peucedani]